MNYRFTRAARSAFSRLMLENRLAYAFKKADQVNVSINKLLGL